MGRKGDPSHRNESLPKRGSFVSGEAMVFMAICVGSACLLIGVIACYLRWRTEKGKARRRITDSNESSQRETPISVAQRVRPRGYCPTTINIPSTFLVESLCESGKPWADYSTTVSDSSTYPSPKPSSFHHLQHQLPSPFEDMREELSASTLESPTVSEGGSKSSSKWTSSSALHRGTSDDNSATPDYPKLNYDIQLMDLSLRSLGEGACGRVKEAFYMADNSEVCHVAVKYARDSSFDSSLSFRSELDIISSLPLQRNILQYHGGRLSTQTSTNSNTQDACFIVMELMFTNLQHVIHGHMLSGKLNCSLILSISLDIAHGLDHLHRHGIIHYDLKPSNVLLDENLVAKLADFGSSKRGSSNMVTASLRGTEGYIAPEVWLCQYIRRVKVTEKLDIYSMGVVMWEMVTGENPPQPRGSRSSSFQDSLTHSIENLPRLLGCSSFRKASNERCPPALHKLIEDCVQFEPSLRPPIKEVRARLEEIQVTMRCRVHL